MKIGFGVSSCILFTSCETVLSQLEQIIIIFLINYLKLVIAVVK